MTTIRRIPLRATRDSFKAGEGYQLSCSRHIQSKRTIKENDVVLLKAKSNDKALAILTKRLLPGGRIRLEGSREHIAVDDIIGKSVRDLVATHRGTEYRILQPSLAEYVDLSPRIVTPIYSQDANLIVSLLDLHPAPPNEGDETTKERLEIFEAGTGHGALTLYLARAIHGANTAAPPIPENTGEYTSTGVDEGAKEGEEDVCLNAVLKPQAKHEAYDKWRANRRAVIHTLDISERHSAHAQITLKNFREGMYFPNVDFHVGTIHGYISGRLTDSPEPFFDHAILDLPNTQDFMEIVSKALKPNGTLITFCPSVTQINACLLMAKDKGIPFFMERVLEFGCAIGVGGREWDVRLVKPRQARQDCHICNVGVPSLKPDSRATWQSHEGREASEHKIELDASDVQTSSEIEDNPDTPEALPLTPLPEEQPVTRGWEMVCRPKVGGRVAGGGFLGVWRRKV